MTQRTKTILLILVALGVWGYTGLEWFSYMQTDETTSGDVTQTVISYPESFYKISELYEPEYDYIDPFLKNGVKPIVIHSGTDLPPTHAITDQQKVIKSSVAVEENPFKNVKYNGVITNAKGKFGLVTIDDQSHIVTIGDVINGITVLSISEDVIQLNKQGVEISIAK